MKNTETNSPMRKHATRTVRIVYVSTAGLSFVLCGVIAGLWIESYWWTEMLHQENASVADGLCVSRYTQVGSSRGSLVFWTFKEVVGKAGNATVQTTPLEHKREPASSSRSFNRRFLVRFDNEIVLLVPHWFAIFAVGTSGGLLGWFYSRMRRRELRARQGACRRCGYDLTGNTSGVCPECEERT